jgi:hypothetical protein
LLSEVDLGEKTKKCRRVNLFVLVPLFGVREAFIKGLLSLLYIINRIRQDKVVKLVAVLLRLQTFHYVLHFFSRNLIFYICKYDNVRIYHDES